MTNASEICVAVKEAQDAGRTVYITDSTETRKVISAEFLAASSFRSHDNQALLVLADCGNGASKPWEIVVTWPWNDLDGWALGEVDGNVFIAPKWWFEI